MEFLNSTPYPTLYYDSLDQFGALFHVVIVRQRFLLTPGGLVPAELQAPVRDTDEAFEDDCVHTIRQESDLSPYKPKCDVVVNAVAYAPTGTPSRRVQVRVLVESAEPQRNADATHNASGRGGQGETPAGRLSGHGGDTPGQHRRLIDKTLVVTGERQIVKRSLVARGVASVLRLATLGIVQLPTWKVTSPKPFFSLPLRYEYAYGGENRVEVKPGNRNRQARSVGADNCLTPDQVQRHPAAAIEGAAVPLAHSICEQNPVGQGFATTWYLQHGGVKVMQAPRIEYPDEPFDTQAFALAVRSRLQPRPAGFGILGRAWQPRRSLLGPIAEKNQWEDSEFPTLPAEFDHRYWNSAPADQQCAHLRGDEFITLVNLTPAGASQANRHANADTVQRFQLPGQAIYLALGDANGRVGAKTCALDTVYVDPEAATVDLVWRGTLSVDAAITHCELRVAEPGEDRATLTDLLDLQEQSSTADLLPAG
jgi:hypothetical protein